MHLKVQRYPIRLIPALNPNRFGKEQKMKRVCLTLSTLLLGILCLAACAPAKATAAPQTPSQETLAQGNTAFAEQLYGHLVEADRNTFFSPHSISSALAMTYGGARENTAREMQAVLHFQLDPSQLHPAFKALDATLAQAMAGSGQKLNIANALILTGGDVSREYKQILEENYAAEIFPGDLGAINGWVKEKTEAKIEKILEELDPNSVCVILNAIYFKGLWELRFDKSRTQEAPFKRSANDTVNVPLMNQKGDFKLLSQEDFQAIALPYKGKALSMVVLLPRQVEGLRGLEAKMTPQNLEQWLSALDGQRPQKVQLYLPRFKLETSYDLALPLKTMGMRDAFDMERADFRGMGWPKGRLYISQAKHKAFVEVNEEGTEAAAATAVEMATKSMPAPPEVFRADRPFLFLIRHDATGTLLFMGRMVNPAQK
jgi:serpin B